MFQSRCVYQQFEQLKVSQYWTGNVSNVHKISNPLQAFRISTSCLRFSALLIRLLYTWHQYFFSTYVHPNCVFSCNNHASYKVNITIMIKIVSSAYHHVLSSSLSSGPTIDNISRNITSIIIMNSTTNNNDISITTC